MPNIIIHGLKSNKLLTRGFGFGALLLLAPTILRIDYARGNLRLDHGRNSLSIDYARNKLQTPS